MTPDLSFFFIVPRHKMRTFCLKHGKTKRSRQLKKVICSFCTAFFLTKLQKKQYLAAARHTVFFCHQLAASCTAFPVDLLHPVSRSEFADLKNLGRIVPASLLLIFIAFHRKISGFHGNLHRKRVDIRQYINIYLRPYSDLSCKKMQIITHLHFFE